MMILFSNLNHARVLVLSFVLISSVGFGMDTEHRLAYSMTKIGSFRDVLPFSCEAVEAFDAFSRAAAKPDLSDAFALVPLEFCLGKLKKALRQMIKTDDEEQRELLKWVDVAQREARVKILLLSRPVAQEFEVPQATEMPMICSQHPLARATFVGEDARCVFRDLGEEE